MKTLYGDMYMSVNQATAEVFYTTLKELKTREKEDFLKKIKNEKKMREDFIDIALIEHARKERGRPISAKEYFAKRRKAGNTQ